MMDDTFTFDFSRDEIDWIRVALQGHMEDVATAMEDARSYGYDNAAFTEQAQREMDAIEAIYQKLDV